MSIASYFFVSDIDVAKNSEGCPEIPGEFLKQFYRVMNTSLESLYPVLTEGKSISLNGISNNDEYTSFTFSFPEEFISVLSDIDKSSVGEIIKKWSTSEDCPYDNENDLSDLLTALTELANVAQKNSQELYFRMEM